MAIIVDKGGGGKKKKGVRDTYAYVILGKRGQGKSTKIEAMINKHLKEFSKRWKKNGYIKRPRVLIHDPSCAFSFKKYPDIIEAAKKYNFSHPLQLLGAKDTEGNPLWKYGVFRFSRNEKGDPEMLHRMVHKHFEDGMVVFDECSQYIGSNPSEWQKDVLIKCRNSGLEAVYVFHTLAMVPPTFTRGLVNAWVLFDTGENIHQGNYNSYLNKYPQREQIFEGWQALKELERTNNYMQPHVTIYV